MKKEATGIGAVTSFSFYDASAGRLYIHLFVFIRRTTYVLFEQTGEMLCILKSQSVGYFRDGLVGVYNPVFGKADEFGQYILLGCLSGFLFNEVAKVVGRKEYFVRKVLDGRISLVLGICSLKILVEQSLKLHKDVFVYLAPGIELPFIKAHAVIKQQFNIFGYQCFAMLVYGMVQFQPDFIETINDDLPFLFG